jgi:hypothetical protein
MTQPKYTSVLTALQREDHERARLRKISLKWGKISKERAKEDCSAQNLVGAMTDPLSRYELDGIAPTRAITICLDVNPSEVELALATNGTSLRCATLTALLAAMVVADIAALNGRGTL